VRDLSPVRAVRAQAPDPAQTHRHVTHGPQLRRQRGAAARLRRLFRAPRWWGRGAVL